MRKTALQAIPVNVIYDTKLSPLAKEVLKYNSLQADTVLEYKTMCPYYNIERDYWPSSPCVGSDAIKHWGLSSPYNIFNRIEVKLRVYTIEFDKNLPVKGHFVKDLELCLPYKSLDVNGFNLLVEQRLGKLTKQQLSFIRKQVDDSVCYEEQLQKMIEVYEDMLESGLITKG